MLRFLHIDPACINLAGYPGQGQTVLAAARKDMQMQVEYGLGGQFPS